VNGPVPPIWQFHHGHRALCFCDPGKFNPETGHGKVQLFGADGIRDRGWLGRTAIMASLPRIDPSPLAPPVPLSPAEVDAMNKRLRGLN
jgi:hypothetical protein